MNFNASRNVGQAGGPRKAKRVSDVSAMGAPSAGSTFSPAPAYNQSYEPAGPPSAYQQGIQVEPGHEFATTEPAGNFGYMTGYPGAPMPTPTQMGSMLQQPIVQDMALQYGSQLAAEGRAAVSRELGRFVAVSQLRYYFAVDTRYVLRKLLLIMFPFTHKTVQMRPVGPGVRPDRIIWNRVYFGSITVVSNFVSSLFFSACSNSNEWMVKYDQETPVQPRYDVNAPDLYLPAMGYVTYVLLAGFMLGLQHRFSPEQISIQASSALAYIIFEMVLYLVTLYVTNTTTALKTLDLLAFSGYKYSTMIVSLLGALTVSSTGYYCCLVYSSCALSYFLVKTLRLQLLSGPREPEAASYNYGYGAPDQYAGGWSKSSNGGTKRRLYFLLFVALTQPLLSWWLTHHLLPAPVAPAPPGALHR